MSGVDPTDHSPGFVFATTNWTRILTARGESIEAKQALSELCEAYYNPVETFIRRARHDAQDSRDLTHDFFAKVLAGHSFDNLRPRAGRFRSYLLGAVKHFLADQHDRRCAAKRGGGKSVQSLDSVTDSSRQRDEWTNQQLPADPSGFPPDAFFDRYWAIQLLNRVMSTLTDEQERTGHAFLFMTLKPSLIGDSSAFTLSEACARLNMSEGAVKVAVHRLRKRFRQLLKAEIAATVASPDEVSSELSYLIEALSHAQGISDEGVNSPPA